MCVFAASCLSSPVLLLRRGGRLCFLLCVHVETTELRRSITAGQVRRFRAAPLWMPCGSSASCTRGPPFVHTEKDGVSQQQQQPKGPKTPVGLLCAAGAAAYVAFFLHALPHTPSTRDCALLCWCFAHILLHFSSPFFSPNLLVSLGRLARASWVADFFVCTIKKTRFLVFRTNHPRKTNGGGRGMAAAGDRWWCSTTTSTRWPGVS